MRPPGSSCERRIAATVEHAVGLRSSRSSAGAPFPATLPESLRAPSGMPEPAGELLDGGLLIAVPITGADGAGLGTLALLFREERRLAGPDARLPGGAGPPGRARARPRPALRGPRLRRPQAAGGPAAAPARRDPRPRGGRRLRVDLRAAARSAATSTTSSRPAPTAGLACVGDVCGKGTEAAVITGLARHTIRAAARTRATARPRSLAFLNGALRRHVGAARVLHRRLRGARRRAGDAVASRSGSPPAATRSRSSCAPTARSRRSRSPARCSASPRHARLDEVAADASRPATRWSSTPTASRTRAPPGGERFGEERLLAAVRGAAGGDRAEIADAVEAAVRAHQPGASADDRAIVVLRVRLADPRRERSVPGGRGCAPGRAPEQQRVRPASRSS